MNIIGFYSLPLAKIAVARHQGKPPPSPPSPHYHIQGKGLALSGSELHPLTTKTQPSLCAPGRSMPNHSPSTQPPPRKRRSQHAPHPDSVRPTNLPVSYLPSS